MDESRPAYGLKALGTAGAALRLPGRGAFPDVDDHLVEPEVTRDEMIGGVRVVASPAHPPHADRHTDLDYVLRAHVAPGYRASTDLLTRHDEDSDFASDACVRKEGRDPDTGGRYLEEVAFEVVSEQNERYVTEKAQRMHRRGVRRIFTVWIKTQRVCEWSSEKQSWCPLDRESRIEDRCLAAPLEVTALLDAAAADNAVVEALAAKDNRMIRRLEAEAEAKGRAEGMAESILGFLEARGIVVGDVQRQEMLGCHDLGRLNWWLRRAALAASADDLTAEA